jgi:hypothetical protein
MGFSFKRLPEMGINKDGIKAILPLETIWQERSMSS